MNAPTPPETIATMNADGSRRWLKPRLSTGRTYARRRVVAYLLIAIFVAIPLLRLDGRPLVLFDLARRELHLARTTFYADDVAMLSLFLLSTFIGIFLVTALFGRVWCGWGCPQTVYMEWVFRPIERLFESKGRKGALPKAGKYLIYGLLSLALSHVFLGYFVPVEELARWVTESPSAHPGAFALVMGVAGLMFFDFAYFREQMCTVICPYARLQSALLDRRSWIVAYDEKRGEPRSKLKVIQDAPKSGDCVDCRACVTTCPTGIDIRMGLQLECIACSQCADACDAIMTKLDRPLGLIRTTTKDELEGAPTGRRLRARLIVYPALLTVFLSLLALQISSRAPAELQLLRASGQPFVETADGKIINPLKLKIRNRRPEAAKYRLEVGPEGLRLMGTSAPVEVGAGTLATVELMVEAPRAAFEAGEPTVVITVSDESGFTDRVERRLLGPSARRKP